MQDQTLDRLTLLQQSKNLLKTYLKYFSRLHCRDTLQVLTLKIIQMKHFTKLLLCVTVLLPSAAGAQYCMLPGRTIYSSDQPGITNFKLNTIDRTSGHVEKPLNMPSLVVTTDSTTLTRGQT